MARQKKPMVLEGAVVTGESGTQYAIKQNAEDGSIFCTCPAWRNQHDDPSTRLCKHIEFLVLQLAGHFAKVRGV